MIKPSRIPFLVTLSAGLFALVCALLLWMFVFHAPLRSGDVDVDAPFDTGLGTVPRIIFTPELPNLRDIGGWRTVDGRTVRQGLVFRSSCFNDGYEWYCSGERTHQITDVTRDFLVSQLGIRTDLDLRQPKELKGMEVSPLGPDVRFVNIPGEAYGDIASVDGAAALVAALRQLLVPDALPLVVHCKAGKDRGGSFVFVLNGLLGVPLESLRRDWELSALWFPTLRSDEFVERFSELVAVSSIFPGETLQERLCAFVQAHGLTAEELARLRELLVESQCPVRQVGRAPCR